MRHMSIAKTLFSQRLPNIHTDTNTKQLQNKLFITQKNNILKHKQRRTRKQLTTSQMKLTKFLCNVCAPCANKNSTKTSAPRTGALIIAVRPYYINITMLHYKFINFLTLIIVPFLQASQCTSTIIHITYYLTHHLLN